MHLAAMTVTEPERRATMVGTFSLCASHLSLDLPIDLSVYIYIRI